MAKRAAVIGMGQMGSAMATRLVEQGYDVVGYDINESQRSRLASDGFLMAATIREAVAQRSVVLTSLPNSEAMRHAWLGNEGLVKCAEPGTLCVELSTIDPYAMQEGAAAAARRGLTVVDCPRQWRPW